MKNQWRKGFIKDLVCSLDSGISVNGESQPAGITEKGVLKVSSISYGMFCPDENKKIVASDINRAKVNPQQDRVLISRSNGSKDLVGASAYIDKNYNNLYLPDKLWQVEPNNKVEFSMRWFYYYINSSRIKELIKSSSTGSSSMHNLKKEDFLNFPILIPPYREQDEITNIIISWDKAIIQTQQLIEAKQKLKQGLMQQLLTGKARFPEFGEPSTNENLPTNWNYVRFKQIFGLVKRKNVEGCQRVLTASGKFGLVDQQEFFNRNVSGLDLRKYYHLYKGEFAYNRSAMKAYPFGAIKRLESYQEGIVSTLYICFSSLNEANTSTDFYSHYFESGLLNKSLAGITQVGGRAHGLLNVTNEDLLNVKVLNPPFMEQVKIATTLNTIHSEIKLAQHKLKQLEVQKQGLMQVLLTGKIRVNGEEK